MYLDIGNGKLISEDEIIVIINVSNDYFEKNFEKDDLDFTENVEFVNEDMDITIRSLVVTDEGIYKSNISGYYLMNNFMKGIE